MAEHSFQEVMRQWRRMCAAFEDCEICPQYREYQCYNTVKRVVEYGDIESLESNVMAWAAEHPEPVYPSWYEWLANMNVVPIELPPDQAVIVTDIGLLKKIPADVAGKLGIEPKEV